MATMEDERVAAYLYNYRVTPEYGFLLPDAATTLPPYFEPWLNISRRLQTLVEERGVRRAVSTLPLLDHGRLQGYRQHRLAHMVLGAIGAAFVWQDGDDNVARVIPRALAIPWCAVSQHLGLPPILVHADLALANWTKIDPGGSCDIRNLRCIQVIAGGRSWEWFFLVVVLMEMDIVAGVRHAVGSLFAADRQSSKEVLQELTSLAGVLRQMKKTLSRMHENLPGDTFYNVIRPFLNGWTGPKFGGGVIYEGVYDEPKVYSGGSAAQSTGFQCFDVVLGVSHSGDAGEFLRRMRSYMPPFHRQLVEDLEKRESVRAYVLRHLDDEALVAAYNCCLEALYDLRSYHLQIVTKYVIIQSNRHVNQYGGIRDKGTGGQSLVPFLKVVRSGSTLAHVDDKRQTSPSSSSHPDAK